MAAIPLAGSPRGIPDGSLGENGIHVESMRRPSPQLRAKGVAREDRFPERRYSVRRVPCVGGVDPPSEDRGPEAGPGELGVAASPPVDEGRLRDRRARGVSGRCPRGGSGRRRPGQRLARDTEGPGIDGKLDRIEIQRLGPVDPRIVEREGKPRRSPSEPDRSDERLVGRGLPRVDPSIRPHGSAAVRQRERALRRPVHGKRGHEDRTTEGKEILQGSGTALPGGGHVDGASESARRVLSHRDGDDHAPASRGQHAGARGVGRAHPGGVRWRYEERLGRRGREGGHRRRDLHGRQDEDQGPEVLTPHAGPPWDGA